MTTVRDQPRDCAVCRSRSVQSVLASTSSIGPQDLDGRPHGPARWAYEHEIETCPQCSYCYWSISEATAIAGRVVESPEYVETIGATDVPELAARYLAAALVAEASDNHAEGGWLALRAAWACDDAGEASSAAACRNRAVYLFRRASRFGLDRATEHAVMTDLLRRTGRFDEALAVCDAGLGVPGAEGARDSLAISRRLILDRDMRSYTIDEELNKDGTAVDVRITAGLDDTRAGRGAERVPDRRLAELSAYVARHVIAAGLAERCDVNLDYASGGARVVLVSNRYSWDGDGPGARN